MAPRPQTYPSFETPANGSNFQRVRIGRHHVHVVEQENRFVLPRARKSRVEIHLARRRLVLRDLDAFRP